MLDELCVADGDAAQSAAEALRDSLRDLMPMRRDLLHFDAGRHRARTDLQWVAMPRCERPDFDSSSLALRRGLTRLGAAMLAPALVACVMPNVIGLWLWESDDGVPSARALECSPEARHVEHSRVEAAACDDATPATPPPSASTKAPPAPTPARPAPTPTPAPSASRPPPPAPRLPPPAPAEVQPQVATPEPVTARITTAAEDHGDGDVAQHVEYPEALASFFAQLARVASGEGGAIARIAHYGDSAVAADGIASTARQLLQSRFGDSGHGFTLFTHGAMYYAHRGVENRSIGDWEALSIMRRSASPERYGYGGLQSRGRNGASASVGTSTKSGVGRTVSRFELSYQRYPGGGPLELTIDDQPPSTLQTHAPEPADAFEVIELPDGPHTLTIRAPGASARVYGVALERSGPGVIYDSLGIVGARAVRLLQIDAEHLRAQIARRKPDLIVLAYGGNESVNSKLNIANYKQQLVQVLQHVRSGRPEMACMLMGPLDKGERNAQGAIVTLDILPKIVQAQREVSKEQGCAFFDVYSAMGGPGSMGRWSKARPRLAWADYRHATAAGYEVIGNLYYRALMKAFAAYVSSS